MRQVIWQHAGMRLVFLDCWRNARPVSCRPFQRTTWSPLLTASVPAATKGSAPLVPPIELLSSPRRTPLAQTKPRPPTRCLSPRKTVRKASPAATVSPRQRAGPPNRARIPVCLLRALPFLHWTSVIETRCLLGCENKWVCVCVYVQVWWFIDPHFFYFVLCKKKFKKEFKKKE